MLPPFSLSPSSVLVKGVEEDACARVSEKPCAVTALLSHIGESHQHLGIQELLHRAGPTPRGCGSCEANGKLGRVSRNLPVVFGMAGGEAVATNNTLPLFFSSWQH